MQKYKNILITGANSFLGTNVALELAQRGIGARAIVRHSNQTLDAIEGLDIVRGNVAVAEDLTKAAAGCDCIVHIAAITSQSLPRYAMYRAFNVGAIENVVAAARANGIKRIIFVSSANTIGNGTREHPAHEERPAEPPFATMLYGRSKIEAEAVLRATDDLDWTILNPCFMLGAHDSKPSSGQIIMMCYGKRVVFAPQGGKNIVSVKAAARALCNAIERGRRGENYLLAGENISTVDFFRLINPRAHIIVMPKFLLMAAGYVGDFLRFSGVHTPLNSDNMLVISQMEYYSGAKAESELGLEKTSIEASARAAIEWFIEHKMLRR